MTVEATGSVAASGGLRASGPRGMPESMTKSDLEKMRDRIAKDGGQTPAGLDKMIENFDKAAGEGGKMTAAQFKSYAADNGVELPSPQHAPAGGKPGRPAGGKPPAGGAGGAEGGAAGASSTDVSQMTAEELRIAAAKGNLKAIRELEKRDAEKAREQGTQSTTEAKPATTTTTTGTEVDTYI